MMMMVITSSLYSCIDSYVYLFTSMYFFVVLYLHTVAHPRTPPTHTRETETKSWEYVRRGRAGAGFWGSSSP